MAITMTPVSLEKYEAMTANRTGSAASSSSAAGEPPQGAASGKFFPAFVEAMGRSLHSVYLHNISNTNYRHDMLKKRDLMEYPGA